NADTTFSPKALSAVPRERSASISPEVKTTAGCLTPPCGPAAQPAAPAADARITHTATPRRRHSTPLRRATSAADSSPCQLQARLQRPLARLDELRETRSFTAHQLCWPVPGPPSAGVALVWGAGGAQIWRPPSISPVPWQ